MTCGLLAVLLCGLGPAVATAGPSVSGHGKVALDPAPISPSQISIDAWVDDDGVAYGQVVWVGDVAPGQPPPAADPWFMDVEDLIVIGNTAFVTAVVTHSVFPADIGQVRYFTFTDNSGTGLPDEIDGVPITAGNITVDD